MGLLKLENIKKHLSCNPRIGIIGGGQLAKMTALSALELGFDIFILEKKLNTPALNLATETIYGNWDEPENLLKLAKKTDIVTLENEFVCAKALQELEESGNLLFPSAKTIYLVQDKFIQKQTLSKSNIPVIPFFAVNSKKSIEDGAKQLGWPLVLKAKRNAYDGKGNATLHSEVDIDKAWEKLGGDKNELYIESFCEFNKELAIIITRSIDGKIVNYPVVESVQKEHICHITKSPASIDPVLYKKAIEIAYEAVIAIDGVGSFGVEMFLMKDERIILNEIAPRVHNSGHYTIEACECSQFENHIRAILGMPLGSTKMRLPNAVMINLLGKEQGTGYPVGIDKALSVKGAHIHIYGKKETHIGRKMGHITALGKTLEEAEFIANDAARHIEFGVQK